MNSQRLKQQAKGLHCSAPSPLCVYYSYQFSIFMELLSVWMSEFLILTPALGAHFLLSGCLVQPQCDVMAFVLSYCILCCHVWLSSLRSLLFSSEIQKGRGGEDWEE